MSRAQRPYSGPPSAQRRRADAAPTARRRQPAIAMGKIRLRRPRLGTAPPLRPAPAPPRAPIGPPSAAPRPTSAHKYAAPPRISSFLARIPRPPYVRACVQLYPVFVFSDSHNESDNSSVRDRCLRARHRQRQSAATPRRRERGDPDVPVEAAGPSALHAQEPEDLEVGGDPARHRLHLRPAVGAGEPPRHGAVRRGGRVGQPGALRDTSPPGAAPARTSRDAQHHPAQVSPQSRHTTTQNSNHTRKAESARQALVLSGG